MLLDLNQGSEETERVPEDDVARADRLLAERALRRSVMDRALRCWAPSPLMGGFREDRRGLLALMFENAQIRTEQLRSSEAYPPSDRIDAMIQPLIRRVADVLVSPDLFATDPMPYRPGTKGLRKLRARCSFSAFDDLRAFYGIDAEVEMVIQLSRDIAYEIDRENLLRVARRSEEITTLGRRLHEVFGYVMQTAARRVKVDDALRMWAVVPPEGMGWIHEAAASDPRFSYGLEPGQLSFCALGWEPAKKSGVHSYESFPLLGYFHPGCMLPRVAIYQDPYAEKDIMLVGFRQGEEGTALVWQPELLVHRTACFLNPDDFSVDHRYMVKDGWDESRTPTPSYRVHVL